ncbi:MAG: hypothetical protein ACT4N8_13320 [Sphingosinicella sp.]|uniref:hypothetical protein n=1 Tax=Sphingosinicella sp. TaxID=1917971 RepID=UPI004037D225
MVVLTLAAMGGAALQAPLQRPDRPDVFACSFVRSANDEPGSVVDLRVERRSDAAGERWRLDWAEGRSAEARPFEAEFGSVGGSSGIEWTENGETKRAYISYSDISLPNGQIAMFLSLDRPSLWQPPGYVCQTAALEENRQ